MTPLKRKRLALDLTQEQLAKKIGVTKAGYSGWETGRRTPEAGQYGPIAKALGITKEEVVDLVCATEKPETAKTESATA